MAHVSIPDVTYTGHASNRALAHNQDDSLRRHIMCITQQESRAQGVFTADAERNVAIQSCLQLLVPKHDGRRLARDGPVLTKAKHLRPLR